MLRHRIACLAAAMVAIVFAGGESCPPGNPDPEGDDCRAAKQHVCDNIEGQACSVATMDDAMSTVRADCGDEVADAFAPAVEQACEDNALGECTSL